MVLTVFRPKLPLQKNNMISINCRLAYFTFIGWLEWNKSPFRFRTVAKPPTSPHPQPAGDGSPPHDEHDGLDGHPRHPIGFVNDLRWWRWDLRTACRRRLPSTHDADVPWRCYTLDVEGKPARSRRGRSTIVRSSVRFSSWRWESTYS